MSWSISQTTKGKKKTIHELHTTNSWLPVLVRALIEDAVRNSDSHDDSVFVIEGHGHQAEGKGSHDISTCNLSVRPLRVQE